MAVPLLGLLLAPMAGIFTGLVFARNADKSAAISSALAKSQQNTQLAIAESQQTTQLAIAYRNLEQSREIANRQQETQLKLAYLNIAYQARLEERREDFQIGLELSRQQFQERIEHLRFGQQLTLEQARQAFQLKLNSLQHQQQLEIQEFIQSVNLAISERNLDFQKWRTEQEMSLQKELATYNRQTQFAIAAYQRETAFLLPQVHKIFENWPLTLVPAQILDSHHSNGVVPMRVVISPPEVDFDKFERSPNQHFPKIEKRLAEGLGQFLSTNYPLNSPTRPTELLDGAWESNRFRGGASIKSLFGMLKSEPMLILESDVDGDYLNFRIAYWDGVSETYSYERIISRLPYRDILYESAKARALKWKTEVRDKLLAKGKSLEEINQKYGGDNSLNLAIIEEDEEFRGDGISIPRHYRVNSEDWDYLCQVLVSCHCLVTGWIADAHYLINYDVNPLFPELLATLINDKSALPVKEVVQSVISGYQEVFNAIKIEQPHRVPQLYLELAIGLTHLQDKSWAKDEVINSLKSFLEMRGLAGLEAIGDLEVMKSVLAIGDDEYFEKLNKCLALLGTENCVAEADVLLNTWRRLKDIKIGEFIMSREALETLKVLFKDYPETFNIFNLESLEGDYLKQMFNQEAFASLINLYVTGRTGAGKTSLGNSLLNSSVMKSNGFQDCTDFIGFFKLGGNLSFYDTPGVCSKCDYENINRAALLLEQKAEANKYSENPGKPLLASDTLVIKDFSKCTQPKVEPEEVRVTVGQWQSQEMQADVEPDVILYVLAPDKQFLDADREYLGLLLEKWGNIVIPILNLHRDKNGSLKPTQQHIDYARRGIAQVYRQACQTDQVPTIVEVNCKTGDGIAKITELICQTLPPEKVGNFGQVLQDDLKKYAEKERQQRYYRTLSLISAVLSRRTVDKKVDGRSLLQTAGSAINIYGIMTFKTAEALSEVNIDISDKVEGIEKEKTKQKVIKEDITQTKEIKEQRAVYGEIKETKQVVVPKMKEREVTGWFGRKRKELYQDNEVETLTSTTYGIKDYKDVVVGTINEVIGQTEKFVGTEYEKGGYSAIQFLLSLGLGLEIFCNNQNESAQWSACFEQGQILAERKLESVKPQIEQLIESSTGEKELIKILEGILLK